VLKVGLKLNANGMILGQGLKANCEFSIGVLGQGDQFCKANININYVMKVSVSIANDAGHLNAKASPDLPADPFAKGDTDKQIKLFDIKLNGSLFIS